MGQRFTIERTMEPKDREAFDAFVLDRLPTVDEAVEWAQAKGYRIPRSSVARYMAALQVKEASDYATDQIKQACGPGVDLSSTAIRLIIAQLTDQAVEGMSGGAEAKRTPLELYRMIRTLKSAKEIEALTLEIREVERKRLAEIAAEQMKKLQETAAVKGKITDEDSAEAGKTIFG